MANKNENLVYGWTPQALGATASQTGYAQPGVSTEAATVSAAEQVSAGAPFPAKSGVTEVLTNPGYASAGIFEIPASQQSNDALLDEAG